MMAISYNRSPSNLQLSKITTEIYQVKCKIISNLKIIEYFFLVVNLSDDLLKKNERSRGAGTRTPDTTKDKANIDNYATTT